jgi:hypothetical protein
MTSHNTAGFTMVVDLSDADILGIGSIDTLAYGAIPSLAAKVP